MSCLGIALIPVWISVAGSLAGDVQAVPFTLTEDVIYGRKYGTALTMDVFTPK
jgi:hypothetical protein